MKISPGLPSITEISLRHKVKVTNPGSMSTINPVYIARGVSGPEVLKVTPKHNVTSLINPSAEALASARSWTNAAAVRDVVMPEIKQIHEWPNCFSITMSYLELEEFQPSSLARAVRLTKSLKYFHELTTSSKNEGLIELPWHNFSSPFKEALAARGRWNKVERFLHEVQPKSDTLPKVVNHNDLHDGNIYLHRGVVCYLDLSECCIASPINDLGIVAANYLLPLKRSANQLITDIVKILHAYTGSTRIDSDAIYDVLVYTMRKLYQIEGYFSYLAGQGVDSNENFTNTLQAQQDRVSTAMDII